MFETRQAATLLASGAPSYWSGRFVRPIKVLAGAARSAVMLDRKRGRKFGDSRAACVAAVGPAVRATWVKLIHSSLPILVLKVTDEAIRKMDRPDHASHEPWAMWTRQLSMNSSPKPCAPCQSRVCSGVGLAKHGTTTQASPLCPSLPFVCFVDSSSDSGRLLDPHSASCLRLVGRM